jgi:hypothetical protein
LEIKPRVASDRKGQEKLPGCADESQPQTTMPASHQSQLWNWHGWLNIILVFLVLEIAVFSVEQARWITPQPSLTLVLIIAVLTAWLLARSRLHSTATYTLALVLGVMVTVWQTYNVLPLLETTSRFHQLVMALQSWWQAKSALKPGEETLSFAIFLILITWIAGYVSTWFILRKQNAWVAVSFGAIVILVNLSNLPEKHYIFFGFYSLAAMILIIQTRLVKQNYLLERGTSFLKRAFLYFMVPPLCLVILAFPISWITPEIRVPQFQTMIATRMLWKYDIEKSPLNLFSSVPAKQPLSKSSAIRDLVFGEGWPQGDRVDFVVSSERPSYWREHMYDTYTSQGWTNQPTNKYLLEQDVPWGKDKTISDNGTVTYTVTVNLKTDVLLTAGDFISCNMPVLAHVGAGDITTVSTPRLLNPDECYTITSGIFSAAPSDLSVAGEDYPQPITDYYLQLPPDFPERIRQLSEDITREAKSPYDKVLAISSYLAQIPYSEEVEAPPQGIDGVEHFLFTQKSGFCVYFASAMAVMLRSVNVPSRLITGYLPGEFDVKTGEYTLRDKHYHAWLQAYFPGYGWVDLEATPGADSEADRDTSLLVGHTFEEGVGWDASFGQWEESGPQEVPGEIGIGEVSKKTSAADWRWPLAEELGQTLLFVLGGTILITILVSPILALRSAFYRWLWNVDRSAHASGVYTKMCILASKLRLGPKPQQTPLEYATELTAVLPLQAKAIDGIVQTYVENRFGRRGRLGLFEEAELLKSRRDVYCILLKRLNLFKKLLHKQE